MKLTKLSIHNNETGWNIDELQFFKNLSLLVGVSGVGKTQILRNIMLLRDIATGQSKKRWLVWDVEFTQNSYSYRWKGEVSIGKVDLSVENNDVIVVAEEIYKDGGPIVKRDSNEFVFCGNKTPKLDSSRSAVALLKEEDLIAPIYSAWRNISLMSVDELSPNKFAESMIFDALRSTKLKLGDIKELNRIPQIERLYLLYKNEIDAFDTIKETFKSIFPLIETIDFEVVHVAEKVFPMLRFKEVGVKKWIRQTDISSGMFRTLIQIVMIVLANDGDVILIDEFENSLGVNCMDSVADLVLNSEADVQFIITSHHPYIINNVDFKSWKIITRDGSRVSAHSPEEFRIGTHSKHDAIMQLIQLEAFKTGKA